MSDDRWLYALALSGTASGIAGLLVPLYLVRIGANAAALGVAAALSAVVSAPGAVIAGRYADRTGQRRGIVIAALSVVALTAVVVPMLDSVSLVIAVNAVLGLALAAVGPVVTLLVVGNAPEGAWNDRIARLNTFQGYGGTAGLVLGAVWTSTVARVTSAAFAQESLFGLAAAVGVASVVLAGRSLPPEQRFRTGPRRAGRIAVLLAGTNRRVRDATFAFGGNRVFWGLGSGSRDRVVGLRSELSGPIALYFAAAAVFFAGFAAFWAPLPIYLTGSGFDAGTIFGLYLVNNLASTVLFARAGRTSTRHDLQILQGGALGLRGAAFLGVGVLGAVGLGALPGGTLSATGVVAALLALVGVSWAFIAVTGTAIVSRLAPARSRGAILGTYAALSALAGSVGGLAGGWLATRSFTLAFGVAAGLVFVGAVIVTAGRYADWFPTGPVEGAVPAPDGGRSVEESTDDTRNAERSGSSNDAGPSDT